MIREFSPESWISLGGRHGVGEGRRRKFIKEIGENAEES